MLAHRCRPNAAGSVTPQPEEGPQLRPKGILPAQSSQHVDLVVLWGKVGVDHGGVDALVAEPLGDLVDTDALHNEVAGECVTQCVEGEVRKSTRFGNDALEFPRQLGIAELLPLAVEEASFSSRFSGTVRDSRFLSVNPSLLTRVMTLRSKSISGQVRKRSSEFRKPV